MLSKQIGPSYNECVKTPRLKLWEIAEYLICPVVGQCLSVDEQRQVVKRTKFRTKKMTRHELHEILVSCAHEQNYLSGRVDALLQRNYEREGGSLLCLDKDAFMVHFRDALRAGDYRAALWVAAVHPDLPLESRREIFGEIHMAMHFSGDERMKMKRKINAQEKVIAVLEARTGEAVGQRRTLQKENDKLKCIVSGLEAKIAAAEREKALFASDLSKVRQEDADSHVRKSHVQNKEMEELRRELIEMRSRETALKGENMRLMTELEHQRETVLLFRQETREVMKRMAKADSCSPSCPAFDLCKKRVLIVGGISRMESLYRELIESSNGIFEYHDGYVKNGVKQLESRLKRADVVLCPVNCNSHGACSMVKNLAKKHRKTVHMLSNFSLSAVSGILHSGDTIPASLN